MTDSLFTPMAEAGLTSMKFQYDWTTGVHSIQAGKEWEDDFDFSEYSSAFHAQSLLTAEPTVIGTQAVRELFEQQGLQDYLDRVQALIAEGRHQGIEIYYHRRKDIRFMCHQHSRKLGQHNKRHATMAGGIRRHDPAHDELEVISDGLNLSRAMTFKNIAADLDFGGSKTTVQMPPLALDDYESLGFLAFCIDRCRTMTGPDMNFPTAMSDVINRYFSPQFNGGPGSPIGESGRPTAYGTYLALREAIRFREGHDSLAGKKVAVMGLGAVGWHLAHLLSQEDVVLYLADVVEERLEQFQQEHPETNIVSVDPQEILRVDADILCPAAIGGVISEDIIDELKFTYIFGPANNQLQAVSEADEIYLAQKLHARGILFQTEWWHNTAGVMAGAEEYINGQHASKDSLYARIEQMIPGKTRKNLLESQEAGITPTENAYRTCHNRIYGDHESGVPTKELLKETS